MEILRFALLGLGIGALYAVSAQGLVLIYRASGVVNFAQGGFLMAGGYTYYEMAEVHRLPAWASVLGATFAGALLGGITHFVIIKPMKRTSPIARVVATLGVLMVLQSIAVLRYKQNVTPVRSFIPTRLVHIFGSFVSSDRLIILGIGAVATAVLWTIYKYSSFGRVTTAVAENDRAAASTGHSPDAIAAINWIVGGALAGVTGALIAPITFLSPSRLSELILPILAAALLGGFSSFPLAFIAGVLIGVGESITSYEVAQHNWWSGLAESLPFLVIVVYLMVRGRSTPIRSQTFDRLPKVGSGRIRVVPVAVVSAAGLVGMTLLQPQWAVAATATVCFALVCLSVLVVTGYAGQLSLAQYVIGAFGSFVAAKLMSSANMPFTAAFALGVLAAVVVGAVFGVPALRTRGVNLAITTLGISIAFYALLLTNVKLTDGSTDGIGIHSPNVFGLSLDPAKHPQRYGSAAIVALVILAIMVANLRRGVAGRRLLAVRSNERAALALGVRVYVAKLYAFMLSAGIAAVGVSILAFLNPRVLFARYDVMSSIGIVTSTVVGGVGMIGGPILGSTMVDGGLVSRFLDNTGGTLDTYLPLIGGVAVLLVLRTAPDGMFETNRLALTRLAAMTSRRGRLSEPESDQPPPESVPRSTADVAVQRVEPKVLAVRDVTVRFGGVVALDRVSIEVRPGTVHGLIGPNGAGKTTLIDALTGFARLANGTIELDGTDITCDRAAKRVRRGLARSFQNGELFMDLTVRENLAIGGDAGKLSRYVTDLFWPGRIQLSEAGRAAADEFDLELVYDHLLEELPFGRRRLVAIARAVATTPSVLLLDEPAAGLDDSEARELGVLIRSLAERWNIGILLVEHNLDLVTSVSDEITVLDGGSVLLPASEPALVKSNPAVVEAYVGTPQPSAGNVAAAFPRSLR
jgi:ABC-type branched-subunit amino acid transport system ATPase component/branched-subunit amino acid ABC-type transport system permease component